MLIEYTHFYPFVLTAAEEQIVGVLPRFDNDTFENVVVDHVKLLRIAG
jgi:hypothetical protein